MLDLKQVEAVFTIIWPQQDWNGGDEGFCRAVAEKVVRTLQAAGPEPVAWIDDAMVQAGVSGYVNLIEQATDEPSDEQRVRAILASALVATPPAEQHPDDIAVDCFAAAMKAKLKWEREQRNRSGWQAMSAADLSRILYEHLPKGDPVDVANLYMMLHQNGQQIETPPAEPVVEARNYETFRTFAHEATKAITNLTGGGSEYFGKEVDGVFLADLPRCVERLRDRIGRTALATKPAVKDDETVVALPNWNGWRSIDTAPEDCRVILATAGGWVGEAIMLRDEDTGELVWTWVDTGKPSLHSCYGWMPLPAPLVAPVLSDLRPDGFDGPTGAE